MPAIIRNAIFISLLLCAGCGQSKTAREQSDPLYPELMEARAAVDRCKHQLVELNIQFANEMRVARARAERDPSMTSEIEKLENWHRRDVSEKNKAIEGNTEWMKDIERAIHKDR